MSLLHLLTIAASIIPVFLIYWSKKKHKVKIMNMKKSSDEYWYELMFVTNDNVKCSEHLKKEIPCGENCSYNYLQKIRGHMCLAKNSISMCVYHITLRSILHELLQAHKRNVNVRVISDREMAHHSASIIRELKKNGIPVKVQPDTTSLMHHKFFLIDEYTDEKEVWFGSLNLTGQGLTANWDNMISTDNPLMISTFSKCFEILWDSFDGNIESL